MNDILQHQEYISHEIQLRQRDAQRRAQVGLMGRLADAAHEPAHRHPGHSRLLAIATPIAIATGLLVILI